MNIRIALAGNPNCGKTTVFNLLTGSDRYVGNWPGVTVEKAEGRLRGRSDVAVTDLPGAYSLTPFTPEEKAASDFLRLEPPDVVINVVDATSPERSLFLTLQLIETGIPVLVLLNMADAAEKRGDRLDRAALASLLGCEVCSGSALRGSGISEAATAAVKLAERARKAALPAADDGSENAAGTALAVQSMKITPAPAGKAQGFTKSAGRGVNRAGIETQRVAENLLPREKSSKSLSTAVSAKFFSARRAGSENTGSLARNIKKAKISTGKINFPPAVLTKRQVAAEKRGKPEKENNSNAAKEAVSAFSAGGTRKITQDGREAVYDREVADRYREVERICALCFKKGTGKTFVTEKADRLALGKWTAFPVFAAVMSAVFLLSGLAAGTAAGFGQALSAWTETAAETIGCAPWLTGLLSDGIAAGVGTALSFLPQLAVLFLLLALLEDCGYMARAAFIMDALLRKAGMSGRSFIPFILGAGCGTAGIMSSRTAGSERERRLTIITTTFIPCSAKLPVIASVSSAFLGGKWWAAPVFYLAGLTAAICSCIVLGKTGLCRGAAAPFLMELPQYRLPVAKSVLKSVFSRVNDFVKRAGTVIFLASAAVWFLSSFTVRNAVLAPCAGIEGSILQALCEKAAVILAPLGFGSWEAAAASILGLLAKEEIVGVFGVLSEMGGAELSELFSPVGAVSFLLFNLLCAPCAAAVAAMKSELRSLRLTAAALLYQSAFAYSVSFCYYQFLSSAENGFTPLTAVAGILAALFALFLLRPGDRAVHAKM